MKRPVPPPACAAGWAMGKATPPERLIAWGRGDPEPTRGTSTKRVKFQMAVT